MKYLNPLVFINKLVTLIKELILFVKYLSILRQYDKAGDLAKIGLRKTRLGRLYYVKNLQPEVLLNTDDLQGFEVMQVRESLAEYNDPITKLGIIDFVKTGFSRVKTPDVYAYVIWMEFDFKQFSLERILYLLLYTSTLIFLIVYGLVPVWGHIQWTEVWNRLNSK